MAQRRGRATAVPTAPIVTATKAIYAALINLKPDERKQVIAAAEMLLGDFPLERTMAIPKVLGTEGRNHQPETEPCEDSPP